MFGVSHPPKDESEAERERAHDATALVLSKYGEAVLGLLVRLAQSGRKARAALVDEGGVGLAARFLPLYGVDEERGDVWVPCVLQALSLLQTLCALRSARAQLLALLMSAEDPSVVKALVLIKTGPAR